MADTLYVETAGDGLPVVLLHAGVCDSRMWNPQWTELSTGYRAIRCDLRGFGKSPLPPEPYSHARDIIATLDRLGVDRAVLVGASLGGNVSLEIAVARPGLVSALLLIAPGLRGHRWSDEVRAFWTEEEQALLRGDLDAAVEVNLRAWLYGPTRTSDSVDPAVRALVADMQRLAFEVQLPTDEAEEELLVPDFPDRLGEIGAPTSIIIGDRDFSDLFAISDRLVTQIPGATRTVVAGAAHLPSLERPADVTPVMLEFLARVPADAAAKSPR